MRKYKDKKLNDIYQALLGKTPEQLNRLKLWGALLWAFTRGYEGEPRPKYIIMGTAAYVAFMAGKDSRNAEKTGR